MPSPENPPSNPNAPKPLDPDELLDLLITRLAHEVGNKLNKESPSKSEKEEGNK